MSDVRTAGLILAAGAGTRFGGPKGLARTLEGEPWVARAARMLADAGCMPVLATVGASAAEVAALLPPGAVPVRVPDWASGLSASVRAGLAAAGGAMSGGGVAEHLAGKRAAERAVPVDAVLIVTVDTPGLPVAAVRRVLAHVAPAALVQATYGGRPGHPVLIGRAHWTTLAAALTGDRGAGPYLRAHGATEVECGDLWSGADVDTA